MNLALLKTDDWVGLYVHGRLHYEGHSIPDYVWLELLSSEQCEYHVEDESFWKHFGYHCPPTLEEARERPEFSG